MSLCSFYTLASFPYSCLLFTLLSTLLFVPLHAGASFHTPLCHLSAGRQGVHGWIPRPLIFGVPRKGVSIQRGLAARRIRALFWRGRLPCCRQLVRLVPGNMEGENFWKRKLTEGECGSMSVAAIRRGPYLCQFINAVVHPRSYGRFLA